MSLAEHGLTPDTLPAALQDALARWKSSSAPVATGLSVSLNLDNLLDCCREQGIPLTCVVSRSSICRGEKRGMHSDTARRNGQRQENGDYVFNSAGIKPLSFRMALGLGLLVIENRLGKRIGLFVPQDTIDLFPTPSEQPAVVS